MDGLVAPGATLDSDSLPDVDVAARGPLGQAAPPVLIGALRYPQETGDRAEGQGGRPSQSLAELALAPSEFHTKAPLEDAALVLRVQPN